MERNKERGRKGVRKRQIERVAGKEEDRERERGREIEQER